MTVLLEKIGLNIKDTFHQSKTSRIDTKNEMKRISDLRAWANSLSGTRYKYHAVLKPATPLPDSVEKIRIAGVMDPFTEICYGDACEVKNLSVNNFKQEIEEFDPHLLLIESAWKGKDDGWKLKVSNPSAEMMELTDMCRWLSIPIIFWSKEDPVHFTEFLSTARMCDFIFTTDIDSIGRYKRELKHDNVFLLPFAAAPGIHNPIERYDRKNKFIFAGSYYTKYGDRNQEFDLLLDVCSSTVGIDIFDRNYNTTNARYQFPDRYRQYIIGTLPYNEIDKAYKGYKFGLSINSVKNSQTMFARRLYEQMACNCITFCGYSRAVWNFFGDLVPNSNDETLLKDTVNRLANDTNAYNKFRLLGLRKILSENLYTHRVAYLVEKCHGRKFSIELPEVLVISDPQNEEQLQRVLYNFNRQTYVKKKLLIFMDDGNQRAMQDDSIKVMSKKNWERHKVSSICNSEFIGYFSPDNYYGNNYLYDLMTATLYTGATVLGKAAHYRYLDSDFKLVSDGKQYVYVESLEPSASVASMNEVKDRSVDHLCREPHSDTTKNNRLFSVDEMNFCFDWNGEACPTVDDISLKDIGQPISEIINLAERIKVEEPGDSTVGLTINDFNNLFEVSGKSKVKIIEIGTEVKVISNLQSDRHEYIRFKNPISIDQISQTDRIAAFMKIQTDGNIHLIMALVCLDDNGKKIDTLFVKQGQTLEEKLPEGTRSIHPWLRVSNKGIGVLKELSFTRAQKEYYTWIGHPSYLLISNGYPSYDELYQKFFIHTRVKEYIREGCPIDVFCLNPEKKEGFREFDGVQVTTGTNSILDDILSLNKHTKVLVHFLSPVMWKVLEKYIGQIDLTIWIHGSEIQPWYRREFNYANEEDLVRAKKQSEARVDFWKMIFSLDHPSMHFVFVSRYFMEEVEADIGMKIPEGRFSVIHNYIDNGLFNYVEKKPEDRKRILSIRPFASAKYANDLTVKTIIELSTRDFFKDLEIRIIGDGELFDEVLDPIRQFSNVTLEKRFLPLDEMVELYKHYGIFLVPTRWDSHGVSRDEAMSSGLVPVTNKVAAVPEFVDETCCILAEAEDYIGMANGIERLYRDQELYLRMSKAASERVKRQTPKSLTIAKEIELIKSERRPSKILDDIQDDLDEFEDLEIIEE